jgi:hypothetical protein
LGVRHKFVSAQTAVMAITAGPDRWSLEDQKDVRRL